VKESADATPVLLQRYAYGYDPARDRTPGYQAAFGTPEGVSEASVLASAGQPNRLIRPATASCAEGRGVRELVYELTSRGFGGWDRRVIDAQVVVCIAGDSRVLETLHIEF
jgi:hypothetical protein